MQAGAESKAGRGKRVTAKNDCKHCVMINIHFFLLLFNARLTQQVAGVAEET